MEHPELKDENLRLRARIVELEQELSYLKSHPVFIQGLKGELIACDLSGGSLTDFAASYDLDIDGQIFVEVKFSKLNKPSKTSKTLRWNWSKPLGYLDKGKKYDFLLLIGDKDNRFKHLYPDDSPYVFFLVPRLEVPRIMTSGKSIGSNVQIITNLDNAQSEASLALKEFLVPETIARGLLESRDTI